MSYTRISIVYGVPKNEDVADKIAEWEQNPDDDRWFEDNKGTCGFTDLYSADGDDAVGFCGVELDELKTYLPDQVTNYRFLPTEEEIRLADNLIAELHPELRELAGPAGVYFIWHDS